MQQVTEYEINLVEETLEGVLDDWLARPGVTGVDIGFKWSGGQMSEELALRVHVVQKKDAASIDIADLFPSRVGSIPVDVIQAQYHLPGEPTSKSLLGLETVPPTKGLGDAGIALGSSIGNQFVTAGTLGAKVIDLDGGGEMILSNWHVLAGHPAATAGLSIWQPGRIDGGDDDDVIAHLTRWIIGPYDAAVAQLNGSRLVNSSVATGEPIHDTITPRPGMRVWKVGRTSGYTEAFIDGSRGNMTLPYPQLGNDVLLRDLFRILPLPGNRGEISMPGDSGAVWVDKASGKAVGLHVAGETGDQPEYALAHDIGATLRALLARLPAQSVPPDLSPPVLSKPSPTPEPQPPIINDLRRQPSWLGAIFDLFRRLFGLK